jgi:hypothetical protein
MTFTQNDADEIILAFLIRQCDDLKEHFVKPDADVPDDARAMVLESLVRQRRKFQDQITWLRNGKR